MKFARLWLSVVLAIAVSGCGISPHVRVSPAPGVRYPASPANTASDRVAVPEYTVARGDTLYSIAFRNGLDVRDLTGWNGINPPYTIYPGQRLRLQNSSLPVQTISTPQAQPQALQIIDSSSSSSSRLPSASPSSSTDKVLLAANGTSGEATQPVIDNAMAAQTESLPEDPALPALSSSSPPAPKPGQPGSLIAAISSSPQPSTSPTAQPSPGYRPPVTATTSSESPLPAIVSNPPIASTAPTVVPVLAVGPTAMREGLEWRWPTAGSLIGRFVAGDPTQQGIDIAGSVGQPVVSVADGEVVYSGNGLLGYGEMIIVQHSPDYLSAYGHNRRRIVAEGDRVKSGQMIAEMGQRGSQVLLHFEVRRRGKPVDPMTYLPAR